MDSSAPKASRVRPAASRFLASPAAPLASPHCSAHVLIAPSGCPSTPRLAGMIPLAYSLLEQRTWRRLTRQQRRLAWRQAWEQPRELDSSGSAWGPLAAGGGAPLSEAAASEAAVAAAAEATAGWPAGAPGPLLPGSGRRLYEFCRPGWEYHAKGIWISLPAAAGGGSGSDSPGAALAPPPASTAGSGAPGRWAAPVVTSVGSSNYGWRSLRRDLELNFLLVTRNRQLQQVRLFWLWGVAGCGQDPKPPTAVAKQPIVPARPAP